MRQLMVRYKVKPERVEGNEEPPSTTRSTPPSPRNRTDENPVVTELTQIGSFRLIGDPRND
jgi:hypothetical protein